MTYKLENVSKLMEDLRTRPGLMKMEELEEIKLFIQSLYDHLSVYAMCISYQGTSLNEVDHYLKKVDWYIDFSSKK